MLRRVKTLLLITRNHGCNFQDGRILEQKTVLDSELSLQHQNDSICSTMHLYQKTVKRRFEVRREVSDKWNME